MSVFIMPTEDMFCKLLEDMISTIQVGKETSSSAQLWAPLTLPSSLGPLLHALPGKMHPQIQRRDLSIQMARRFPERRPLITSVPLDFPIHLPSKKGSWSR